ncbi:MAG: RES family NAD+ phosphorylase [Hyphomonadaceae bacterium]|nr:RES family NAD+ phosphorylase [Hyphomonadaceae bacterium]
MRWKQAWRIIASRYPPIDVFERASKDPAAQQALIALEQMTNPRLRNEAGQIALVPPGRAVFGAGASYVMASFTHLNRKGSRFSDGAYGLYYCAESMETAIAETVHHFQRFARDSHDPERYEDMRVLVGAIDHEFHDVGSVSKQRLASIMDSDSYVDSQPFGAGLRADGSDGVVYPSARRAEGECVGAFWPDAVGLPAQEKHLKYHWDGERVAKYFDYSKEQWVGL